MGRAHQHLELCGSFRCQGSAAYTAWVDALLYGTPAVWRGHAGYDLSLADDPFVLQQWTEQATAAGHTARTTAGFCWPWPRTRTLPLDIRIDVPSPTGETRVWKAAWNARETLTDSDGTALAPRSQLWASHSGGHQQIGCIYTAQGLEYHHSGVIIGPDLTWNNGRWEAHPAPAKAATTHSATCPPSNTCATPSTSTASCSPAAPTPPASTPPTPTPSTSSASSLRPPPPTDPPQHEEAPDSRSALIKES
ncbi:DNA/RNA helicase domain-containing protein [Streptomyces sp. NPDC058286]|uniref:DNA/RNA helicase domain-containing protein n=1 Tax=unclassified Streptomyces TaxID=2593676 RepID=UPI0036E7FEC8